MMGIGLAGFFFGMGDGIVTAFLPIFMAQIGSGAAALGLIEGCADAAFHLVRKRGPAVQKGGWKTRRFLGPLFASVQGFLAFALSPFLVFLVRGVSAVGRAHRGLIPEADPDFPTRTSRTNRFYRTMERSGAFLGPTLVLASIGLFPLRDVFLLSFPLSFLAAASILFLVREAPKSGDVAAPSRWVPSALSVPFYPFFVSAGIFRLGNFAVTLLLLRAYELLTRDHGVARAAHLVILLHIFRQALYGATAVLSARQTGRIGKKGLLGLGYLLLGLVYLSFIFIPPVKSYIGLLPALFFFFLLFALGGIGQSLVDSTERMVMSALLPEPISERGDHTLNRVRAFGGFASSLAVGALWSVLSPAVGFFYAALMSFGGAIFLSHVADASAVSKNRTNDPNRSNIHGGIS